MHIYQLPLVRREKICDGTMGFWFDTAESGFTFEAGQNADFTLIHPPETDAEGDTRTFSIASPPDHENEILIATRTRPTAFKNSLLKIPLGTKVTVNGPSGDMTLQEDTSKGAVFIAGGIGITPFRSMIAWATRTKRPHRMVLLYSNRTPNVAAFMGDLEKWKKMNDHFSFYPTITDNSAADWPYEYGRIDAEFVARHVPDPKNSIFYLAGPDVFVEAMRLIVVGLGVSKDWIRSETFSGY